MPTGYIDNVPADTGYKWVAGVRKAELAAALGRPAKTITSRQDWGNWRFLVTVQDCVTLGILTQERADAIMREARR